MGLVAYLLVLLLVGLLVGALGRLLLPGPDPMGVGATTLVGVAASFLAGLVMWAITGGRNGGSLVVSVVVAVGLVYMLRRASGGMAGPGPA